VVRLDCGGPLVWIAALLGAIGCDGTLESGEIAIHSTAVEGLDSSQVRQGAGTVALELAGENLEGIAYAFLGDLEGTVREDGPTRAILELTIPHGVPLGAQPLHLARDLGEAELAAALLITPITAGPDGDDAGGRGTEDDAYRTLKRAVEQSAAGDTIALLAGTYGDEDGETWPIELSGVTLTGVGPSHCTGSAPTEMPSGCAPGRSASTQSTP
jgi:hypothetical protein